MNSPKNPFALKLDALLSKRGEAARLSETTGVPSSHLSKMCAGKVLPSPDTLEKLIEPLTEDDRAELVFEYLLLHRPKNATNVRIIISEQDALRDRLERAIQYLDPATRDALASLVEAVNRAPDSGAKALRGLGGWFDSVRPVKDSELALAAETTVSPPVTTPRRDITYRRPTKR